MCSEHFINGLLSGIGCGVAFSLLIVQTFRLFKWGIFKEDKGVE